MFRMGDVIGDLLTAREVSEDERVFFIGETGFEGKSRSSSLSLSLSLSEE